jgi:Iap family predicted aminopeptidase
LLPRPRKTGSSLRGAALSVFIAGMGAAGVAASAQASFQFSPVEKEVVLKRFQEVPKKNVDREQKVKILFGEAGCSDFVTEQKLKHSEFANVVCRLPGETDSVIIVGAHFDKVAAGTGAIDNWSGASLLSSLYQSLAPKKRHHTFLFVSFCEEELGLLGSEFYASHMTKEEIAKTEAMINLDTLGLSPTKVWVHNADKNLVAALAAVASALKLPASEMDVEKVGSADSESFAGKHIPRITIHSLTQKTLPILHTNEDTLEKLHPDEYYDTYKLVSGYLAYLDETLQPRTAAK